MKKCLDKATNTRRVDIEGKAGKKEGGSEPTCAELIGDGPDEAIDLFETEDDVVLIGEVAIVLLVFSVACDDRCQQSVRWPKRRCARGPTGTPTTRDRGALHWRSLDRKRAGSQRAARDSPDATAPRKDPIER